MGQALRVVLGIVGAVVATVAVLGGVWFLGMRNKWAPVLDLQRRLNRRIFNPRQLRDAGSPGAYAGLVHHVGRTSGRSYTTPVVPYRAGDRVVVALPYGTRPDWVRNVLAAGTATIEREGVTYDVTDPRIVSVAEVEDVIPDEDRKTMRVFHHTQCLELTAVP